MTESYTWKMYLLVVMSIVLSTAMYFFTLSPLSLAPVALPIGFIIINQLRFLEASSGVMIVVTLAFLLDDVAAVPWVSVETITETLGFFLYKSIKVTLLEVMAVFLCIWSWVTADTARKKNWFNTGLVVGMTLIGLYTFTAVTGFIIGKTNGGDLSGHMYQTRMHHVIVVWFALGFMTLSSWDKFESLIKVIVYVTIFKGLQGVFNYIVHYDVFSSAEYLIDHPWSIWAAMTMFYLVITVRQRKSPRYTSWAVTAFIPLLVSFAVNDRRTSLIGIIVTLGVLALQLPRKFYVENRNRLIVSAGIFILFAGATWNMNPPIGVIGSTYRSLTATAEERGHQDYRDQENMNILHSVSISPFTGVGTGVEFQNVANMPDIRDIYPQFLLLPHNMLLTTWGTYGPFGIAVLCTILTFMLGLAAKLMISADPTKKMIGILSFLFYVQFLAFIIADLGLISQRPVLLGGLLTGGLWRMYNQDKLETNL